MIIPKNIFKKLSKKGQYQVLVLEKCIAEREELIKGINQELAKIEVDIPITQMKGGYRR